MMYVSTVEQSAAIEGIVPASPRQHIESFSKLVWKRFHKHRMALMGRKLDFLCQEMFREANTIGSKSADVPAAHLIVELKSEIERLREQVQNIE